MESKPIIKSIQGWRFVFAIILILFHMYQPKYLINGYWAVEFFFIIAGFFLMKKYNESSQENRLLPWQYFLLRIKKFFPITTLIFFIVYISRALAGLLIPNWGDALHLLPEIFYMQGISVPSDFKYFYSVVWFIPALLLSELFLYALIYYKRQTYCYIAFAIALISYTSLSVLPGAYSIDFRATLNNCINTGIVRGLGGVAIGTLLYISISHIQRLYRIKRTPLSMFFWGMLDFLICSVSCLLLFTNYLGNKTFILLIFYCYFVFTSYFEVGFISKLMSKKWMVYGGNISLWLYLIQGGIQAWKKIINTALHKLVENPYIISFLTCFIMLGLHILSAMLFYHVIYPLINKICKWGRKSLLIEKNIDVSN